MLKTILSSAVIAAFALAAPAAAQDKPSIPKSETKTDSKAAPKAPRDIEAFFKEGIEQSRDMPEGCKPKMETPRAPTQSKPVA